MDGTQNAMTRADSLAWLKEEPADGRARILTNARCLTEGIDVPALDAIMFLHPRRSEIDVVQAVGRVMRKSPGKRFGYIILPIARAPGSSPQDTVNDSVYRAVWQVINAIAAHDDRFEAKINQLKLISETPTPPPCPNPCGDHTGGGGGNPDGPEVEQIELPIAISGSPEFRDAILSRVVDKYSNPRYWERWADTVREIAERHEARIRALLSTPGSGVRLRFDGFLAGLRSNLNDGVSADEAIGMLSQHLVSKPVFDALFEDYAFVERNPISLAMQGVIDALQGRGLEKETEGLERFYRDVRIRAEGVTTAAGKRRIIAELYDRFLTNALPDTAANLGIVYTPVEAVDYVIRSVEDVLNAEFGRSLRDEGVHVIDPFVGTGTFITRMIESGIIGREDLARKYAGEFHANEIILLAHYIATVNIEAAYRDATGVEDCDPFDGAVMTDTFQAYERGAPMHDAMFGTNSARIERQKNLPIQVVIGNPPWSATNNRAYPGIDGRVRETYTSRTSRKKVALYDPYIKAIRLASDWVRNHPKGGIVAFVTNGGFIDANSSDGLRKTLAEEFDAIYCYNLRGNARTSGARRREEGGNIFARGNQEAIRAGVAILILVKAPTGAADRRSRPAQPTGAADRRSRPAVSNIHYMDIGDLLTREQKLDILRDSRLATTDWQSIAPNEHGDWIGQRNEAFSTLRPLSVDASSDRSASAPIFRQQTLGLVTSRDAWAFSSSTQELRATVGRC